MQNDTQTQFGRYQEPISSTQQHSLSTLIRTMIIQKKPKCISHHPASYTCISKKCSQQSPFICTVEECKCSQLHQLCPQIKLKSFVKIFDKKQRVKEQIEKRIGEKSDKLVDEISDLRDDMVKRIREGRDEQILGENMDGKLKEQNEKLSLLKQITENDLTGQLMGQIWQADQRIDEQKRLAQIIGHIDKTFNHFTQQVKKDLAQMLKIVMKKNEILKLYWNSQLKGYTQEITGKTVKKIQGSSSDRFALLQPSLTKMQASKVTWSVKVTKVVSWVGLGICIKSIVQKNNFDFINYTEAQHGSYIISSNSHTWSHKNPNQNSSQKDGISIATGNIIYFEMNFTNFVLKYKNTTTNKEGSINVAIKELGENDDYHICSCLGAVGDEIEMGKVLADGMEIAWDDTK